MAATTGSVSRRFRSPSGASCEIRDCSARARSTNPSAGSLFIAFPRPLVGVSRGAMVMHLAREGMTGKASAHDWEVKVAALPIWLCHGLIWFGVLLSSLLVAMRLCNPGFLLD